MKTGNDHGEGQIHFHEHIRGEKTNLFSSFADY